MPVGTLMFLLFFLPVAESSVWTERMVVFGIFPAEYTFYHFGLIAEYAVHSLSVSVFVWG